MGPATEAVHDDKISCPSQSEEIRRDGLEGAGRLWYHRWHGRLGRGDSPNLQHSWHFARVRTRSVDMPGQKTALCAQLAILPTPWCAAWRARSVSPLRLRGITAAPRHDYTVRQGEVLAVLLEGSTIFYKNVG